MFLGVPERVAINDAAELAKRYSEEGHPRFINGVCNASNQGSSYLLERLTVKKSQWFLPWFRRQYSDNLLLPRGGHTAPGLKRNSLLGDPGSELNP